MQSKRHGESTQTEDIHSQFVPTFSQSGLLEHLEQFIVHSVNMHSEDVHSQSVPTFSQSGLLKHSTQSEEQLEGLQVIEEDTHAQSGPSVKQPPKSHLLQSWEQAETHLFPAQTQSAELPGHSASEHLAQFVAQAEGEGEGEEPGGGPEGVVVVSQSISKKPCSHQL